MNVRYKKRRSEGGILLVTLCACTILGILIGSYLSLIYNQQLAVTRAQAWNAALVVAEAGVEEAMAHLNSGVTLKNLGINSWKDLGGGVYEKTTVLGDSYAVVDIKIPPAVTVSNPVVVATGYVPGPISRPKLSRTVQVGTKGKPVTVIPGGMVVSSTIDLRGGGIVIDSFDSSNTNYSTAGRYDPKKARDRAQVTTLSSIGNDITLGNASVKGTVHTGPHSKISTGPHASVGDNPWVDAGTPGIEAGHLQDDANFTIPDVTLPPVSSWMTPQPGNYRVSGATYKYFLNNSSAWKASAMSGTIYIASPNVVLYVTDSFSSDQVLLAPGASVSMYVAAPSVAIGGKGVINQEGQAKNFTYYGLPSNKSFKLSGNADFVGSIYAPNTDFVLTGGGSDIYDFAGSCVVKSVKMNGHFAFHYDEGLDNVSAPTGFVAISWDEL